MTGHDADMSAFAAAALLGLMWAAEWAAPLVVRGPGRTAHGARNIAVGAAAAAVRVLGLTAALAYVTSAAQRDGAGLLRPLDGTIAAWVMSFLILDLWNYTFHVLCHKTPLLWRFHTVHHTDVAPDSTTALRFHFGEVMAGGIGYLIVLPLAGITMPELLFYEAVLIASSIFHHANLRLPVGVERVLRWVIVTPGMHAVHHSKWVGQTDSNYSPVLAVWDWLFETMREGDPAAMEYGLDGYGEKEHSTVRGLMAMPMGPVKSEPGRRPKGVGSAAASVSAESAGLRGGERGRTLAA
jgi:sterol desaturase/sphingolipid hydroxylase (fatty acid hydroxylase superfamily)